MAVRPINAINLKKYIKGLDVSLPYDEQDKDDVIRQVCCIIDNWPTITPPNEWVSVEEGMPKEHDSIFKKLMGPDKWGPGMFERLSDDVIVAVKFADGTRRSGFARTKDGIWVGLPSIGCPVVTHWMPMPEPPDHRLPEKGRKTDGQ